MSKTSSTKKTKAALVPNSVTTTPELPTIASMAAILGPDVDAIFQFVANNIEYVPTFGVQKGALGCLIDGYGNAWDQSALMIALLRANGFTAQFVNGNVKLTKAQLDAWLDTNGTNTSASKNLLLNGGFDAPSDTGYTYVRFEHVWVQVQLSVAGVNTWFVFDPSMKAYTKTTGIDLATVAGYDPAAFQAAVLSGATTTANSFTGLNTANLKSQMDSMVATTQSYIDTNMPNASIQDIIGGRTIVPVTGQQRITTLGYETPGMTLSYWDDIPSSYFTSLRIQYDLKSDNTYAIDWTYYSHDLAAGRLTLTPKTDNSGAMELRLNGVLAGQGTSTTTPGSLSNKVVLQATHPYNPNPLIVPVTVAVNSAFQMVVTPGDYHLIGNGWGMASENMAYLRKGVLESNYNVSINTSTGNPDATAEAVIGEALNVMFHHWNAQKCTNAAIVGQHSNCTIQFHHQVGIVRQSQTSGAEGPKLDMGGIFWLTCPKDDDYDGKQQPTDLVLSMRGINNEGATIQQVPVAGGVCTNTLLDVANAANQTIYVADSSNWNPTTGFKVRSHLTNYPAAAMADMDARIAAGATVIVHENGATVQGSFSGYGYYSYTPGARKGGTVGIITGGLLGAGTSEPQPASGQGGVVPTAAVSGLTLSAPDNLTRVEIGEKAKNDVDSVVDHFTGNYVKRQTDLYVGASFPRGLPFTRTFNGKNLAKVTEVGRCWTHNYYMTCELSSDPYAALKVKANSSLQNALALLISVLQTKNNFNTGSTNLDKSMGFVLTYLNQSQVTAALYQNIVKITIADVSYSFTKVSTPTGFAFIPPAGVSMALSYDGTQYTMTSFDGVKYVFGKQTLDKTRISSIVYPDGNTLTFTYGGPGPEFYLTRVANSLGRSLDFTYHFYYGTIPYLQKVTADSGAFSTYLFDAIATGNLTQATDMSGIPTNYGYDSKFRMVSHQRGTTYTIEYNDQNQVWKLNNPSYQITFIYGKTGNPYGKDTSKGTSYSIAMGGPDGYVRNDFNDAGQPVVTTIGNDTTRIYYGDDGNVSFKVLPFGDIVLYSYDSFNRLLTETHGSDIKHYTYSSTIGTGGFSQWSTMRDANNNVWTRTFTNGGSPLTETDPEGNQKTWTYHPNYDLLATHDDGSGVVTSIALAQYDTHGNPLQQIVDSSHLGLTSVFTYNNNGDTVTVKNPRLFTTSYSFNNFRMKTTTTLVTGNVTTNTYDQYEHTLLTTSRQTGGSPSAQTTTTKYNLLNKPTAVTDPLGNITQYGYDGVGRRTSTLDAENRLRQYTLDFNGRLIGITDALGQAEETRTLYAGGMLHTIKDARNNTTTFVREITMGRLTDVNYPDSTSEHFTYDPVGNVLNKTMRDGRTIGQTYDKANRVKTRSPQGQAVVTFTYDGASRVTSASTPQVANDVSTGTFSRSYDTAGRLQQESSPKLTGSPAQYDNISYVLDANGNVTKITYPGGYYIEKVYDNLDRLQSISLNGGATVATFTYDQLDRRTVLQFNNGTKAEYFYDIANNLTSKKVTVSSFNPSWSFDYNKVHQIVGKTTVDSTYEYLLSTTANVIYGVAANRDTYTSVDSVTQSYDGAARLTNDGTFLYTYDTEGRLVQVNKASDSSLVATYSYDPFGRQTLKITPTAKIRYVYAGDQLMEEYDITASQPGTFMRRYVYGAPGEALFQINADGSVLYLHNDHQGSLIAQTSSTGAVLNKYGYSPFGENDNLQNSSVIGYTGQRFDAETGLYYYRARHYKPSIGRFLQPDPIGYDAGMNLYGYVHNDPLNKTDPSGTEEYPNNLDPATRHPRSSYGIKYTVETEQLKNGTTGTRIIMNPNGFKNATGSIHIGKDAAGQVYVGKSEIRGRDGGINPRVASGRHMDPFARRPNIVKETIFPTNEKDVKAVEQRWINKVRETPTLRSINARNPRPPLGSASPLGPLAPFELIGPLFEIQWNRHLGKEPIDS